MIQYCADCFEQIRQRITDQHRVMLMALGDHFALTVSESTRVTGMPRSTALATLLELKGMDLVDVSIEGRETLYSPTENGKEIIYGSDFT